MVVSPIPMNSGNTPQLSSHLRVKVAEQSLPSPETEKLSVATWRPLVYEEGKHLKRRQMWQAVDVCP